jgi:hypothetical protein
MERPERRLGLDAEHDLGRESGEDERVGQAIFVEGSRIGVVQEEGP